MKIDKSTLKSKISRRKALAILGLAGVSAYIAPTLIKLNPAAAGSGGGNMLIATDATVVKECSECHMPYSPRLLPSSSWRKIMGNLDNHFGEDASISNATRQKIERYLVSQSRSNATGPIRISQSRWFRREHSGDVTRYKAKSWSNCMACHR